MLMYIVNFQKVRVWAFMFLNITVPLFLSLISFQRISLGFVVVVVVPQSRIWSTL